MDHETERPHHIPALDGMRAVACAMVMFSHFVPRGHFLADVLPWGPMGVLFFFVLSGFLVTRILLVQRVHVSEVGFARNWLRFVLRRMLRIAPLFYALLLVLVLLDVPMARASVWWHASFTMNLWRGLTGEGYLSHLWALAVEAQFYVLWPFIILLLPRRWLVPAVVFIGLTAPLYRAYGWHAGWRLPLINSQFIANLDTLAVGALLALLREDANRHEALRRRVGRAGLVIALLGLTAIGAARLLDALDGPARAVVLAPVVMLAYFGLCDRAADGGLRGVLTARPLVYMGTISYGLYVLHLPLRDGVLFCYAAWGLPWPDSVWTGALLLFALSLTVASAAWFALEQPVNRLRHRLQPESPGKKRTPS